MRCSFFEPLLDAYVEGELSPVRRAQVARHLETCARCGELLAELRVIDALLVRPRLLETAPNFTFKTMAEVRALAPPRAGHASQLAILATYIVFGWAAIGAFLIFGGAAARGTIASIQVAFAHLGATLSGLSVATGHLFGRQTFDVTAAMGGILAFDLAAAAGVFAFYAMLRARRAAAQGNSESC